MTPTRRTELETKMTKTSLFVSANDLTLEEYTELLNDEVIGLDGRGWIGSDGSMREAYENRANQRRCVCCQAYIAAVVTGEYDGDTCWSCGNAQEAGDEGETYDRVRAERFRLLVRVYSRTSGRRSRNYGRANKVVRDLMWMSGRPGDNVFPAHAVAQVRADLAYLNGSN